MKALRTTLWISAALMAVLVAAPAAADQVFLDDVIVDGSLCVGIDCVNGESFGFDTIRLKENNLRIKFQDTSSSASFPTNDWQITANESTNGGLNKFSIDDIDGGRTPFTIEASAPSHSLYVDDGGKIGFGTSIPVVDLHVVSGNTPTLRLEQDGSSGFAPQTWDVAGNEANFFIRDVTNGSTLPIRLRPGAPTSAIDIAGDGDIGMGTASPSSALHVRRTNATAKIEVQEASGVSASRVMLEMDNFGPPIMQLRNSDNGINWDFRSNSAGDFSINNPGGLGAALTIDQVTGDVSAASFTPTSSRELKNVRGEIDPSYVLARVAELPISSWSFKQSADVLHIGPMAEDFFDAFGLGSSNRTISLTDANGIAFAAIQGLVEEVESKDARIADLEARLAAIEQAVAKTAD